MDDKQPALVMAIDDTYRVEHTLARGQGGVTELVSIDGIGPFVRKKIPSQLAQRNVWAALSACTNPRLPHVEATYELPDHFVVVYDYVSGRPLEHVVQQQGKLPERTATQLICQLCDAVTELHRHGIIHRDITPSNVIVADDGAHLVDFGIARTVAAMRRTTPRHWAPTVSLPQSSSGSHRPTPDRTCTRWDGCLDTC